MEIRQPIAEGADPAVPSLKSLPPPGPDTRDLRLAIDTKRGVARILLGEPAVTELELSADGCRDMARVLREAANTLAGPKRKLVAKKQGRGRK